MKQNKVILRKMYKCDTGRNVVVLHLTGYIYYYIIYKVVKYIHNSLV